MRLQPPPEPTPRPVSSRHLQREAGPRGGLATASLVSGTAGSQGHPTFNFRGWGVPCSFPQGCTIIHPIRRPHTWPACAHPDSFPVWYDSSLDGARPRAVPSQGGGQARGFSESQGLVQVWEVTFQARMSKTVVYVGQYFVNGTTCALSTGGRIETWFILLLVQTAECFFKQTSTSHVWFHPRASRRWGFRSESFISLSSAPPHPRLGHPPEAPPLPSGGSSRPGPPRGT